MANDYYDATPITAHSTARSRDPNQEFAAIEAGLALLPDKLPLQQSRVTFVTDAGATDAYVVTLARVPPAYAGGMRISMVALNTNTGPATVNVNALGVKQIKNFDGSALAGGEILVDALTELWYDATNGYFRILNPLIDVASVVVNNLLRISATDTTPAYALTKIVAALTSGISFTQTNIGGNETLSAALAISAMTAATAPVDADVIPGYFGAANKKMTAQNFLLAGWAANTSPADADSVLTLDASGSVLAKMTLANLLMSGWPTATTAAASDTVLALISGSLKKITKDNFAPPSAADALNTYATLGLWGN